MSQPVAPATLHVRNTTTASVTISADDGLVNLGSTTTTVTLSLAETFVVGQYFYLYNGTAGGLTPTLSGSDTILGGAVAIPTLKSAMFVVTGPTSFSQLL